MCPCSVRSPALTHSTGCLIDHYIQFLSSQPLLQHFMYKPQRWLLVKGAFLGCSSRLGTCSTPSPHLGSDAAQGEHQQPRAHQTLCRALALCWSRLQCKPLDQRNAALIIGAGTASGEIAKPQHREHHQVAHRLFAEVQHCSTAGSSDLDHSRNETMALMTPSNPLLALQALGGLLDLWDPGWGSSLLLVTSCPLLQQQLPEAAPTAAESRTWAPAGPSREKSQAQPLQETLPAPAGHGSVCGLKSCP